MRVLLYIRALCSALLALPMATMSGVANASPDTRTNLSAITAGVMPYVIDDFNGAAGQQPDPALWNIETGGGGWGNREQQVYTADPRNVRLDGLGNLVIEAHDSGGQITSSRIDTYGKAELTNGLIAARIKMPEGQGLHPAFWMLGDSLREAGYPGSGEIDIVEVVNDDSRPFFTVHGPMTDASAPKWKLSEVLTSSNLSADFHTYWLYKEPGQLVIGIDEPALATFEAGHLPDGARWVQDLPFFALLNIAVAGEWPGPLAPGVLPQQMIIDWVRFYR